jgi:hypothetical protein
LLHKARFKEKCWKCLKTSRQYLSHTATLLSKIRADDIEGLKKAACSLAFNIEPRILPTLLTPSAFLQDHPTLIQVAGLYDIRSELLTDSVR